MMMHFTTGFLGSHINISKQLKNVLERKHRVAFTTPTTRSLFFLVHFKPIKLCNEKYLNSIGKMGETEFKKMFNYSGQNLARILELKAHHTYESIKTS